MPYEQAAVKQGGTGGTAFATSRLALTGSEGQVKPQARSAVSSQNRRRLPADNDPKLVKGTQCATCHTCPSGYVHAAAVWQAQVLGLRAAPRPAVSAGFLRSGTSRWAVAVVDNLLSTRAKIASFLAMTAKTRKELHIGLIMF